MRNGSASPRGVARNRYLPVLSWMLVLLVVVLFIRSCLLRPSSEHQKRVASFSMALRLIREHYADGVDEASLHEAAMKGMVRSLNDPYSAYLNAFQVEASDVLTEGQFGGVGIVVSWQQGSAIIVEVQQGGPAEAAGVRPGDRIVAVDALDCSEMPFPELVSRVRGKVGTTVKLSLQRAETGEQETLQLTRVRILMDSVNWKKVEPGIGYLRIRQFDGRCVENVRKGIEELGAGNGLRALLLDLRGNTGGLLAETVAVCDLFLSEGVIVRAESRLEEQQKVFEASPQVALPPEVPMAVLVDGRSASAAEVMAGALQSHGRATLIGTRTFGKGAVNRVFLLPDGTGIVLTVAHSPAGLGLVGEGKGIEPDIEVGKLPPPPAGEALEERERWLSDYQAAQQEQFDRAVEFLKSEVP